MKKCSRCKTVKNLTDFHNCKTNKDGLSYVCKICNHESNLKYRMKNGGEYRINQQAYRQTREGFTSQLLHGAKTRAKKKGFEFDLTHQDIYDMMNKQEMKCAVSGVEMTLKSRNYRGRNSYKCSIDRINSQMGYTKNNTRLVCWAINQMKAERSDEEFKNWIDILSKSFQQFT